MCAQNTKPIVIYKRNKSLKPPSGESLLSDTQAEKEQVKVVNVQHEPKRNKLALNPKIINKNLVAKPAIQDKELNTDKEAILKKILGQYYNCENKKDLTLINRLSKRDIINILKKSSTVELYPYHRFGSLTLCTIIYTLTEKELEEFLVNAIKWATLSAEERLEHFPVAIKYNVKWTFLIQDLKKNFPRRNSVVYYKFYAFEAAAIAYEVFSQNNNG